MHPKFSLAPVQLLPKERSEQQVLIFFKVHGLLLVLGIWSAWSDGCPDRSDCHQNLTRASSRRVLFKYLGANVDMQ